MFDKTVGSRLHAALDGSNNPNDVELHDALIVAEHMLRFEASLRPSAADCLRLPWFTQQLPNPPPMQLSRAPTNLSTTMADLSVMEPDNPWWPSIPGAAANQAPPTGPPKRYSLRKRKADEQDHPDPPLKTNKIQKRLHHSLPIPRPTPEKIEKAWKTEETPKLKPFDSITPPTPKTEGGCIIENSGLTTWDKYSVDT